MQESILHALTWQGWHIDLGIFQPHLCLMRQIARDPSYDIAENIQPALKC